jgi:hypothetical protein
MFDFAERAVTSAPRGSLLPVLRLYAIFEQGFVDGSFEVYRQPFVTTAVDATLDALAQVPSGHHRLPLVRHLLANALFRTERYAEAVEQFYAIGGYADSVPWNYSSDPVKQFVHARTHAFSNWEKAGRPAAPTR